MHLFPLPLSPVGPKQPGVVPNANARDSAVGQFDYWPDVVSDGHRCLVQGVSERETHHQRRGVGQTKAI